jgi:Tfp pilus assembly protein PilF
VFAPVALRPTLTVLVSIPPEAPTLPKGLFVLNAFHGTLRRLSFSLLILAVMIAVTSANPASSPAAKEAPPAVTMEEANKFYQAEDWARAAGAFAAIVKNDPQNGRAWFRLGACHQRLESFDQAIAAYRRAESIAHNPIVMYNLACAFSLAGSPDSAFAWLGRMADAGYGQPESSTEPILPRCAATRASRPWWSA